MVWQALPDPREPNVTGSVDMEACSSSSSSHDVHAAGQRWFAAPVSPFSHQQQQVEQQPQPQPQPQPQQPERSCPPSSGSFFTLMANTTLPGLGRRPQYLSCRADGQPGHACQPGDDVNVWFFAGAHATNQQWELRPCPAASIAPTATIAGGGGAVRGGAGAGSLLVSALSGACAGASGKMVTCDCLDRSAVWEATVAQPAGGGGDDCALTIANQQ
jgi:hypothetical protein